MGWPGGGRGGGSGAGNNGGWSSGGRAAKAPGARSADCWRVLDSAISRLACWSSHFSLWALRAGPSG
eukprot:3009757-Alexandrium_andersonii.AAC.1